MDGRQEFDERLSTLPVYRERGILPGTWAHQAGLYRPTHSGTAVVATWSRARRQGTETNSNAQLRDAAAHRSGAHRRRARSLVSPHLPGRRSVLSATAVALGGEFAGAAPPAAPAEVDPIAVRGDGATIAVVDDAVDTRH